MQHEKCILLHFNTTCLSNSPFCSNKGYWEILAGRSIVHRMHLIINVCNTTYFHLRLKAFVYNRFALIKCNSISPIGLISIEKSKDYGHICKICKLLVSCTTNSESKDLQIMQVIVNIFKSQYKMLFIFYYKSFKTNKTVMFIPTHALLQSHSGPAIWISLKLLYITCSQKCKLLQVYIHHAKDILEYESEGHALVRRAWFILKTVFNGMRVHARYQFIMKDNSFKNAHSLFLKQNTKEWYWAPWILIQLIKKSSNSTSVC